MVQELGGSLRQAYDTWRAKAEGKAAIDYGLHMIMREYSPELAAEMGPMCEEGVTSYKLFMAYPGVFYMDDGNIFRTMQRAGELGATICMHAENGLVIDALVEQALKKGQTEPRYRALTPGIRAWKATAGTTALSSDHVCMAA